MNFGDTISVVPMALLPIKVSPYYAVASECVTYVDSVTDTPGFDRSLQHVCFSPGVKTPGSKIGRADGTFVHLRISRLLSGF